MRFLFATLAIVLCLGGCTPEQASHARRTPRSTSETGAPGNTDLIQAFEQSIAAGMRRDALAVPDDPPTQSCSASLCSDGNPCTLDTCFDEGRLCTHEFDPASAGARCSGGSFCCATGVCGASCCSSDADCATGDPCVAAACLRGTCSRTAIRGCVAPGTCLSDADCSTRDPCARGSCGRDGRCAFTALPNCCPPGATCDDQDGVAPEQDFCPATPRGEAVVAGGCSASELFRKPEALLDAVSRAFDDAREPAGAAGFAEPAAMLDEGAAEVARGASLLRSGQPCAAVDRLQSAAARANAAADSIEQRLPPISRDAAPDATDQDLQRGNMMALAALARTAGQKPAAAASTLGDLCAASLTSSRAQGTIARVDDAGGRLYLEDGRSFAVPLKPFGATFVSGTYVDLETQGPMVSAVSAPGSSSALVKPADLDCVKFRIAPVQPFWPQTPYPPVLHHLKGYQVGAYLNLEAGMGLAAEAGKCTPPANGTVDVYSLQIDLSHWSDLYSKHLQATLAHDLRPQDTPVRLLPEHATKYSAPSMVAHITVRYQKRNCDYQSKKANPCTASTTYKTETFAATIRPRRSYCKANYDKQVFILGDAPTLSFKEAFAGWTTKEITPGPWFRALGYHVSGGISDHPNLGAIEGIDHFAVYGWDWGYPGNEAMTELVTGVPVAPGALAWPQVFEKRDGYPFAYSCSLPKLVRDALAQCIDSTALCYYKLPFGGAPSAFWLGQGNSTPPPPGCADASCWPTHCVVDANGQPCNNRYAFDFRAPDWTPIRAARRGKVAYVYEQSNTDGHGIANQLIIQHDDGTLGQYYHMPQNGVLVTAGDLVERGQVVAQVGNTGNSTNPHVHFQVDPGWNAAQSIPITFQMSANQAWNVCDLSSKLICAMPPGGNFLLCSTNGP